MNNNSILNINKIVETPVPGNIAKKLISSDQYRDDFLMEYSHFHNDGNRDLYIKWINRNIDSKNNRIIEHAFTLSTFILLYSNKLLSKAHGVLISRSRGLTKLACLDYILAQKHNIEKEKFITLNNLAALHTGNQIVKFQSFVNLSIYNMDSTKKIRGILERTEYPSLFYRFINQMDQLPKDQCLELASFIENEVSKKTFNIDVKKEIIQGLKNI